MSVDRETGWINHEYLDTYRIANRVEHVALNHELYLRDLESLTLEFGISEFIPNWQKDSALHKFIRYIADDVFESDNSGRYKVSFGDLVHPRWTLPLEMALVMYGIRDEVEFEIPDIPKIERRDGDITLVEDSPDHHDACYEYFQGMRLTDAYQQFLNMVSDEVFYVMFTNRSALQRLHEYLAHCVMDCDLDGMREERPDLARYYTRSGRIRRAGIPKWVRRSIFFRDRGLCTECRRSVSGLVDRFGVENYDHIVPLAKGGLNDVTNVQLLCESCNRNKAAKGKPVSKSYQRWY